MKKSIPVLISAVLGSVWLILVIMGMSEIEATSLGDIAGATLVGFHAFLLGVALVFNWIGFAAKAKWAVLTAGIMYCVSGLILVIIGVIFLAPSIVLCFVGYAKMIKSPT